MPENARLAALRGYGLLDATRPAVLDDLTRLAASVFGTRISAISLIDADRQWLIGRHGMIADETPRPFSFCGLVVDRAGPVVVPDAAAHPVYRNWPSVTGAPGVRLYAGTPLIDSDGQHVGAMCVIDDQPGVIGDRQLDMLAQFARQASGHLGAIREQQHLARLGDELSRALSREEEMVASVSHELRTPITTIQGYLELLTEDEAFAAYRGLVEPIRRNADRLVRMVEHLLAGALPTETPLTVHPEVIDLMAVAEAAALTCRPAALHRQVRVELRQVGRPELAFGDADRLREAIEQLLRNAIAFSPAGAEVIVHVSCAAAPRVTVADHGAGIPADELPHVTERFYRGRRARSAATPGIGLGLAIAERIAIAHGGSLQIASNGPDTGVTAQLQLPRR